MRALRQGRYRTQEAIIHVICIWTGDAFVRFELDHMLGTYMGDECNVK